MRFFEFVIETDKMGAINIDTALENTPEEWSEWIRTLPTELAQEFIDERPNPDQEDIDVFTKLRLTSNKPVEISTKALLREPWMRGSVSRTPQSVVDAINKRWGTDFEGGTVYDRNPDRFFKYAKMSAATAKPSVMANGDVIFGVGRMIAALLRGDENIKVWSLKDGVNENFADGKVNEVLDNPAPYTWSRDEFGFPTATAKDLGLHIAFDGRNNPMWEVSFYREQKNGSFVMNRPTGQGKEFQVFATVKAAINDFMKMHDDTESLVLDAYKDRGKDSAGRVRLYRRMMNQYANKLGWEYEEDDQGQMVSFGIHKPRTNENFADGEKRGKSRPGRVKRAGASCNGSVTDLRKRAKNASGEKAKMYHWCANMKSGRKKGK